MTMVVYAHKILKDSIREYEYLYMGTAKSIGEYSKIESKNVWVIYNPDDTPRDPALGKL